MQNNSFNLYKKTNTSGFSLVEMIIVIGITVTIFFALFGSFKFTLGLIAQSKTKLAATSLANDRMEYIRSLPYNSVGTVSGIPNGAIPQNRTVTLNGVPFYERVLIEYVDDPADGLDVADSNSIVADYKKVKIEYTWNIGNASSSIYVISNIVPRSIETTAGGGTIRVNVLDQNSQLLPGASVRLFNTTGTVDVTRFTDVSGSALFSGAPADAGYQVIVSGPIGGNVYSVDRTYEATTTNPSPVRGPFALLEGDVSTQTFSIGEVSDLTVRLLSNKTEQVVTYDFADLSGVASSTSVVSDGTRLILENIAGNYAGSAEVFLTTISPTTISRWGSIKVAGDAPADTNYRIFVYQPTTPYALVPNADLPGNSSGFSTGVVDISGLDVSTYPELVIGIQFSTINPAVTPSLDELSVFYVEAVTPLASEGFTLRGDKLIGANIYKNEFAVTTNGAGEYVFSDLEYDLYNVIPDSSYTIAEECSAHPISHVAGVDSILDLVFVSPEVHSLIVKVVDGSGLPVPGAEVRLSRPGYNTTVTSGICGQSFFSGVATAQIDFEVEVTSIGYTTANVTDVVVDGVSEVTITLAEN